MNLLFKKLFLNTYTFWEELANAIQNIFSFLEHFVFAKMNGTISELALFCDFLTWFVFFCGINAIGAFGANSTILFIFKAFME